MFDEGTTVCADWDENSACIEQTLQLDCVAFNAIGCFTSRTSIWPWLKSHSERQTLNLKLSCLSYVEPNFLEYAVEDSYFC